MKTMKYYAVVAGHQPGIYNDWPSVVRSIGGYPAAYYRSFNSEKEAHTFLNSESQPREAKARLPIQGPATVRVAAVSYQGNGGYGLVITRADGEAESICGPVPASDCPQQVADFYSVYVALYLFTGDLVIETSSRSVVDALTFLVRKWINEQWRGVVNRAVIEACYNLMTGRNIEFRLKPKSELSEAFILAEKGRCCESKSADEASPQ